MGQSLERAPPIRLRLRPRTRAHFVSGERRLLACWRRQLGGASLQCLPQDAANCPRDAGATPSLHFSMTPVT